MSKRNRRDQDELRVARALRAAARFRGWLLEMTEDEIRESEEQLDEESVELPESLLDPFARLGSPTFSSARPTPLPPAPDEELAQNFARAARAGRGSLPAELEEKMRADKRRAVEAAENTDE